MAEYQVNIAELQEICNYVINADYPYFEELREAFKLLRHTGCREMEIFEIQRWSQVSGDEFTLTPQKGNNNRTIILGSEFSDFKAAILGQYPPFLGRTYSQLQNLFKRVCPYWPIYSGGKQITLYTFRYLFLHELKADGLTNQQIANIMGHVNVETVSNYLDAVLSSENEVPIPSPIILPNDSTEIISNTMNFDGFSTRFLIPQPITSDQYSVFFRFKVNEVSTKFFLSGIKTSVRQRYHFIQTYQYGTNFYIQFGIRFGYTSIQSFARIPISTNNIFNILYIHDYSEPDPNSPTKRISKITYYINSSSPNQNPDTSVFMSYAMNTNLNVGCDYRNDDFFTDFFNGQVDKFAILNRIISSQEISTLFNSIPDL